MRSYVLLSIGLLVLWLEDFLPNGKPVEGTSSTTKLGLLYLRLVPSPACGIGSGSL